MTTILTPRLDYAIYLGVVMSAVLVLKNTSELEYSHISYDEDEDQFVTHQNVEKVEDDNYIIINLTGTMHFNAAENLKENLNNSYVKNKVFIIRMRRIDNIDLTVIEEIDKFIDKVQESGGKIILSGVKNSIYKSLKSYGITDKLKEDDIKFYNKNLYSSTKNAIKDVQENGYCNI